MRIYRYIYVYIFMYSICVHKNDYRICVHIYLHSHVHSGVRIYRLCCVLRHVLSPKLNGYIPEVMIRVYDGYQVYMYILQMCKCI
jgi:hypothetical protein